MMFTSREEGFDTKHSKELFEKWKKQPFHYKIGKPNTLVEAKSVYNLSISGENGNGILEWDERDSNGEFTHKTYKE